MNRALFMSFSFYVFVVCVVFRYCAIYLGSQLFAQCLLRFVMPFFVSVCVVAIVLFGYMVGLAICVVTVFYDSSVLCCLVCVYVFTRCALVCVFEFAS